MFLQINDHYGITGNKTKNEYKISYLNGLKIKKNNYYFPSDATGIGSSKGDLIKIVKSEYLERYRLGIGGYTEQNEYISYGDHKKYGYIDTTGTATGYLSKPILMKALSELIEKNELFNFWYTNVGDRFIIHLTKDEEKLIDNLNFIANHHIIFGIKSLSTNYTVISIAFKDECMTACGVACESTLKFGVKKAILETKLIEWQQYKNPNSLFYQNCKLYEDQLFDFIESKSNLDYIYPADIPSTDFKLDQKISFPEIIVLGKGKTKPVTIKLISTFLLNCIPSKENLNKSKKQKILKNIDYNKTQIDCIIV